MFKNKLMGGSEGSDYGNIMERLDFTSYVDLPYSFELLFSAGSNGFKDLFSFGINNAAHAILTAEMGGEVRINNMPYLLSISYSPAVVTTLRSGIKECFDKAAIPHKAKMRNAEILKVLSSESMWDKTNQELKLDKPEQFEHSVKFSTLLKEQGKNDFMDLDLDFVKDLGNIKFSDVKNVKASDIMSDIKSMLGTNKLSLSAADEGAIRVHLDQELAKAIFADRSCEDITSWFGDSVSDIDLKLEMDGVDRKNPQEPHKIIKYKDLISMAENDRNIPFVGAEQDDISLQNVSCSGSFSGLVYDSSFKRISTQDPGLIAKHGNLKKASLKADEASYTIVKDYYDLLNAQDDKLFNEVKGLEFLQSDDDCFESEDQRTGFFDQIQQHSDLLGKDLSSMKAYIVQSGVKNDKQEDVVLKIFNLVSGLMKQDAYSPSKIGSAADSVNVSAVNGAITKQLKNMKISVSADSKLDSNNKITPAITYDYNFGKFANDKFVKKNYDESKTIQSLLTFYLLAVKIRGHAEALFEFQGKPVGVGVSLAVLPNYDNMFMGNSAALIRPFQKYLSNATTKVEEHNNFAEAKDLLSGGTPSDKKTTPNQDATADKQFKQIREDQSKDRSFKLHSNYVDLMGSFYVQSDIVSFIKGIKFNCLISDFEFKGFGLGLILPNLMVN